MFDCKVVLLEGKAPEQQPSIGTRYSVQPAQGVVVSHHGEDVSIQASSSEGEGSQREQRDRGQDVASGRRVSQRDQGDTGIDVDLLISSIQERGPLWDSRDPRHMDQVVSRRLWAEVAKSLWDGFDSASAKAKGNFMKKLRTRWRSMKDRFNKGIRAAEEQARSGAAASKSVPYKYNRALQFLRPVLSRRQ
ncbi:uncharacterized protein LOC143796794 [Ranitomeya variabilis]|uniref:uncharacterized protein LOC143796794 n=1 Tax=Ranitomeya variabilis TaxID=490064 RepID=UPI00405766D3